MAVTVNKATIIANRDSTPTVLTEPQISNGDTQDAMGYLPVATTDSIGSSYLMTQIPSNARITALTVCNEALTAFAINLGLYYATNVKGAPGLPNTAVGTNGATFFASALSLATANQTGTNQINQAGNFSIPNQQLPLWQAAGLTADPECMFDIVAVSTAAATAAGNFNVRAGFIR